MSFRGLIEVILAVVSAYLLFLTLAPAIVFAHELGHYSVARGAGIGVVEFSLGREGETPLYEEWFGPTRVVVYEFPFYNGHVLPAAESAAESLIDEVPPETQLMLLDQSNWVDDRSTFVKLAVYSAGIFVELGIIILMVVLFRRYLRNLEQQRVGPDGKIQPLSTWLSRWYFLTWTFFIGLYMYMWYSNLMPAAGKGYTSDSFKIAVGILNFFGDGERLILKVAPAIFIAHFVGLVFLYLALFSRLVRLRQRFL